MSPIASYNRIILLSPEFYPFIRLLQANSALITFNLMKHTSKSLLHALHKIRFKQAPLPPANPQLPSPSPPPNTIKPLGVQSFNL